MNSGTAEEAEIREDDPEDYVEYCWECSCVDGAWPRLVRCSGSVERYNCLRQAEICRYGRAFNGAEDSSGCGCSEEEEIDDGLDSEGSDEVGQDVDSGGVKWGAGTLGVVVGGGDGGVNVGFGSAKKSSCTSSIDLQKRLTFSLPSFCNTARRYDGTSYRRAGTG